MNIVAIQCRTNTGELIEVAVSEFLALSKSTSVTPINTVPKSNGKEYIVSGISVDSNGIVTFHSYTNSGVINGTAQGLIAHDSNGKLISVPLTLIPKTQTQSSTTDTSVDRSSTERMLPIFEDENGNVIDSTIFQTGENYSVGGKNPFWKWTVEKGSVNIDQNSVTANGYRLNGKLVLSYDSVTNKITIGNATYNVVQMHTATLTGGVLNIVKEGNASNSINWTNLAGTVTDYLKPSALGFELKSSLNAFTLSADMLNMTGDSIIATNRTAWMLGGNAATAQTIFGTTSGNFDIQVLRNNTQVGMWRSGGLTVPNLIGSELTASELVATDSNKKLVSLAVATYPSLAELTYLKGVTSAIQAQITAKFTLPSLTANYVTKSNGTTLVNSQIFDNGSNVGFGTTSPSAKLEVNGNIGISPNVGSTRYLYITSATDTYTGSLHIQSGGGSSGFGGAINMYGHSHATKPGWVVAGISVGAGTAGDVNEGRFAVNSAGLAEGAELFTVLRTGYVGIGIAKPLTKFQVSILTNSSGMTLGSATGIGFSMVKGDEEYGLFSGISNTGAVWFQSGRTNTATAYDIAFQSSGGNVGIATLVPAYKLDVNGTGRFVGAVQFDAVPSSLVDATTSNHLVRYSQWIASTSIKYLSLAVKSVALTNITLSGTQTVSGVALIAADRCLVVGQTTQANNGIYDVSAGAWTRATDSDTDAELRGYIISVSNGTYAGYKYINTNGSTITVGSTSITYGEFSNITEIDPVFVAWRDTSRTANTFFSAPNGSNGAGTWRAIATADVPTLNQNTSGSAATLTTARNIAITGDLSWNVNFNGSAEVTAVGTLATVNSNIGTFNNVTVNAKGLVTAASNVSYLTTASLTTNVTGILPIANGGTGSSTKNFVDLTTTQSSIEGIKTFNSNVNFKGEGIAYTNIGQTEAFDDLLFENVPVGHFYNPFGIVLSSDTSSYGIINSFSNVFTYNSSLSGLLLGTGLTLTNQASERLQVNGNIRYSGTLKPSNTTPATGQFLKANSTSTNIWASITISDISSGILAIANGGTGSSTKNFVDLTTTQTVAGNKDFTGTTNIQDLFLFGKLYDSILSEGVSGKFLMSTNTGTAWTSITTSVVSNLSSYTGFDARYFTKTESNSRFQEIGTYLTTNQTITLSGIITGSGTTSITTAIANDALSIAKTSGLQAALDAKMPLVTGTVGQVFTFDGTNYNFMNLDHKPIKLNQNQIAVGNEFGLLESRSEFTFNSGSLRVSNKTDAAKCVTFGMINPSGADALLQVIGGGALQLSATDVYLNNLGGNSASERVLTIDQNGKIGAKVLSTTGGGTQLLQGLDSILEVQNVATNKSMYLKHTSTNPLASYGFVGESGAVSGLLSMDGADEYLGLQSNLPNGLKLISGLGHIDINASVGDIILGRSTANSKVILSGTSYKLNLANTFSGASNWGNLGGISTPQNGDMVILTYDASIFSFVMNHVKKRTGSYDSGKTYLTID